MSKKQFLIIALVAAVILALSLIVWPEATFSFMDAAARGVTKSGLLSSF